MLGMHSETCPELVMALNNKLMVQFIRKHTTGEGSCETEVENDLKKHENLFRTGFGIEHCDVKPPGQPWPFTGGSRLMPISLMGFFKIFHKYLAYAFLGLFISILPFLYYKQNTEKIAVMK